MRFVGRDIQLPDNRLHPLWQPQAMQQHAQQGKLKPAAEPTIDDTDPTARAKAAAWQEGRPYQPAA